MWAMPHGEPDVHVIHGCLRMGLCGTSEVPQSRPHECSLNQCCAEGVWGGKTDHGPRPHIHHEGAAPTPSPLKHGMSSFTGEGLLQAQAGSCSKLSVHAAHMALHLLPALPHTQRWVCGSRDGPALHAIHTRLPAPCLVSLAEVEVWVWNPPAGYLHLGSG
jgi:hypothetical protein